MIRNIRIFAENRARFNNNSELCLTRLLYDIALL